LRKFSLILALILPFFVHSPVYAQQFDAAFGAGTTLAPSASSASGNHNPVTLAGGTYPVFSADLLLKRDFGVSGELAWRAGRMLYGDFQPARPLFYDFNAIYAPRLGKFAGAELMGGVGWESIRFYQPTLVCGTFTCTDFVSSNHFMGHFGGGIRYYIHGNIFIRPEAHVYLIRNNQEFSSPVATRVGISIGYTFRPGF
jgi:hypothetical protein